MKGIGKVVCVEEVKEETLLYSYQQINGRGTIDQEEGYRLWEPM